MYANAVIQSQLGGVKVTANHIIGYISQMNGLVDFLPQLVLSQLVLLTVNTRILNDE